MIFPTSKGKRKKEKGRKKFAFCGQVSCDMIAGAGRMGRSKNAKQKSSTLTHLSTYSRRSFPMRTSLESAAGVQFTLKKFSLRSRSQCGMNASVEPSNSCFPS